MVVTRSLGIKLPLDLLYTLTRSRQVFNLFCIWFTFVFFLIFQAGDIVGGYEVYKAVDKGAISSPSKLKPDETSFPLLTRKQ